MRKIYAIVILTICLTSPLFAQRYSQAVGPKVGTYFGGSYKNFISDASALEGIVAFDWEFSTIGILGNYVFIQTELNDDWEGLDWYTGVGGQLWVGNDPSIGPSGMAGLEYNFEDEPISIFTDFTLYLGFGEESGFKPQFALGIRKTF